MSAYSALELVANNSVRDPTPESVRAIFAECGLLHPERADERFGNLAPDITELFSDKRALAENDRFFCPDTISFNTTIQVIWPDGDGEFEGPGCCISIHGNGYFYPWGTDDIRERVLRSPKLVRLRLRIQEELDGRFLYPDDDAKLRSCWLDGTGGWVWFGSQSL